MPRKGFTSITVPEQLKYMLENLCRRYDLNLGQCILFLYEFYRSVVHDPGMMGMKEKKLERVLRRVKRKYKELIMESKSIIIEEPEEGER